MGSGDINLAGLRMTPAEWAALDDGLRTELLRLVITGQRWDREAYDSFELGLGAGERHTAKSLRA